MKQPSQTIIEFAAQESVRRGVCRLADLLAVEARATLQRPGEERAASLHACRLLIKRFRALLRLLRPTLGREFTRRHNDALRRAAKRLSAARDADVALVTLGKLSSDVPSTEAVAVAAVRSSIESSLRRVDASAIRGPMESAARAIARTASAIGRARWRRKDWSIIEGGLRTGYRRARRRYHAAEARRDPESFHAWRTAAKSLMYQLGLIRPAAPKELNSLVARLETLQDTLGADHDLWILDQRLKNAGKGKRGPASTKKTLELVAKRQQRLRKKALQVGKVAFEEKPRRFVKRRQKEWKSWRRAHGTTATLRG